MDIEDCNPANIATGDDVLCQPMPPRLYTSADFPFSAEHRATAGDGVLPMSPVLRAAVSRLPSIRALPSPQRTLNRQLPFHSWDVAEMLSPVTPWFQVTWKGRSRVQFDQELWDDMPFWTWVAFRHDNKLVLEDGTPVTPYFCPQAVCSERTKFWYGVPRRLGFPSPMELRERLLFRHGNDQAAFLREFPRKRLAEMLGVSVKYLVGAEGRGLDWHAILWTLPRRWETLSGEYQRWWNEHEFGLTKVISMLATNYSHYRFDESASGAFSLRAAWANHGGFAVATDDRGDSADAGYMTRQQFDEAVESIYFRVPQHLVADRLSRLAYADADGVHYPYRDGDIPVDLARCDVNPYSDKW